MVRNAAAIALGVAGCGVSTRDRSLIGLPSVDTTIALMPVPPTSMHRVLGPFLDRVSIAMARHLARSSSLPVANTLSGARLLLADPGQCDVGPSRVLAGTAPGGLAVANEPELRHGAP